jgi:Secretion system C-terminal sorting domain
LGGSFYEGCGYTIATRDSGYLAVGLTQSYTDDGDVTGFIGDYTNQDGWAVKLDGTGALQWEKCVSVRGHDVINAVVQGDDLDYLICGRAAHGGTYNGLYGKMSPVGNFVWVDTIGGPAQQTQFNCLAAGNSPSGIGAGIDGTATFGEGTFWVVGFGWFNSVRNLEGRPSLSIAPDPAKAYLDVTSMDAITDIAITDILGRTVISGRFHSDKVRLDVSGLMPGMYFAKINGAETLKFVKQ